MRVWFVVLATGTLLGCGGDTVSRETVYPVRGRVLMHGQPLADAAVLFAPRSGQPTASGRTNANGEFTLTTYEAADGAAAGEYAVTVTKTMSQTASGPEEAHSADPSAPDPGGGHGAQQESGAVSLVPPQYMSVTDTPLSATVEAGGKNEFEFTVQ